MSTGAQSHTAGHLLVAVVINQADNTTASVANTAGDVWSKTTSSPIQDGLVRNVWLFYTLSTAGNASDNTTATFGLSESYTGITVLEFSTTGSGFTFGADSTGSGTGTAVATGSITAGNPAVIVAGAETGSESLTGGSYTLNAIDAGAFYWDAYHIVTTSEAFSATAGSAQWLAIGASFNESAGGGGRGLFRTPPVSGVGVGGSFFRDPLQAREQMVRRDRIFVPERYAA